MPKLEGAAEIGDYLTADLVFHGPDGRRSNELKEAQFRLQSELRFQNGTIPGIGAALVGVKPGETREVEANLGTAVDDPALRAAKVGVQVRIKDLKRIRLPELNQSFLDSIGIESLDNLREAMRESLERRIRDRTAPFDPPPDPRHSARSRRPSSFPPSWSPTRRRARSASWSRSSNRTA